MDEKITESNRVTIRALLADWEYYHNIPDWQRGIVWETPKQRAYVRALLEQNYTYPMVMYPENGKRFVLDGQQRLHSIWQFYTNRLGMYNNNMGRYFKDLSGPSQERFLNYALTFDTLHGRTIDELVNTYIGIQNLKAQKPAEKHYAYSTTTDVGRFAKELTTKSPFFTEIFVPDQHKSDFTTAIYPIAIERMGGLASLDNPTITNLVKGVSHDLHFDTTMQYRVEDNLLYAASLFSGVHTKARSAVIPMYQAIVFLKVCKYDLDHSETGALKDWFNQSVGEIHNNENFYDGTLLHMYRRASQETFWLNNLRPMASSAGLVPGESSTRQVNRLYSWFYRNAKCLHCGETVSLVHFHQHAFSAGDTCSVTTHSPVHTTV